MAFTRGKAVVLGERYRDTQTGIEGVAVARTEYQFGCERIGLEVVADGKIEEYSFDAPRLVAVVSEAPVRHEARVGGTRAAVVRTGLR